ncbi:hypothetical protein LIER_24463 [Lithospermum erythrorhizon]|uniref:Uncharacterized protein n=1 Tax=Lithospermum erythrorhizon TaxID=34254 RepID=A0AAV3R485_LITER
MKSYLLIYLLLVSLLAHHAQGGGRKLLTKTTPGSTIITTSKNEETEPKMKEQTNNGNETVKRKGENVVSVDSPHAVNENHQQHYPENEDIADMDYSPALRKPPIHN